MIKPLRPQRTGSSWWDNNIRLLWLRLWQMSQCVLEQTGWLLFIVFNKIQQENLVVNTLIKMVGDLLLP